VPSNAPERVAAAALGSGALALATAVAALLVARSLETDECGRPGETLASALWLASGLAGVASLVTWGYGRWARRPALRTRARPVLAVAFVVDVAAAAAWVAAFVAIAGYGFVC
jgi:hypothetical protein